MSAEKFNFDQVVESIRQDVPNEEMVRAAGERVWERMTSLEKTTEIHAPDRLRTCADFRAVFPSYLNGTLSDARRMLVEDHTHSCPECRRELDRARGEKAVVIPFARKQKPVIRWAMAAAAGVALLAVIPFAADRVMAPSGPRATVATVDGQIFRVTAKGLEALTPGAAVQEKEEIRTAKASYATLKLADGSIVEMDERAELSVSSAWRGSTIKLDRGNIIVQAAKQGSKRLRVDSGDAMVTVKGTIFSVSRGAKGSRVSVVEGEVQVDQSSASQALKPGQQAATDATLTATNIADEVAWSKNSAKYMSLLGEFALIERRLSASPGPALRYSSRLAKMVPANAVLYVALPNLAPTIADAQRIIEDRVRESAVLKEWWNDANSQKMRFALDRVRAMSEYLGDEIVITAIQQGQHDIQPIVLAEVKKPGLAEFLDQQIKVLAVAESVSGSSAAKKSTPFDASLKIMQNAMAARAERGPVVLVTNDLMAITPKGEYLNLLEQAGTESDFTRRIQSSYQNGAGWLIGADLAKLVGAQTGRKEMAATGLDTVQHVVFERKDVTGRAENRATLSFSGDRHGVMAWLAAPGPMGSLEFVAPDTAWATSFVVKNPKLMLEDMMKAFGSDFEKASTDFRAKTGVDLMNDLAATLGGEASIAFSGAIFPRPNWQVAAEVYDANKLVWSIERLVESANREMPAASNGGTANKLAFSKEDVNGRTYYKISASQMPFDIHFTFADSYLIAGPGRDVLDRAIANRNAGVSLSKSPKFRALLPRDGYAHFSAIVYSDLGTALAPMAEQLKNSGLLSPDQKKSIDLLDFNKEPSLIYAYGERDRITVASSSNFFGMGIDALLGLNAPGKSIMPSLVGQAMRGGQAKVK